MKYLIHDYLEATAAKYPEKTAFVDPDGSVTFAGLVEGAQRVASALAGYTAPRATIKKPEAVNSVSGIICFGEFLLRCA